MFCHNSAVFLIFMGSLLTSIGCFNKNTRDDTILVGAHIAETANPSTYTHRLDLANAAHLKIVRIPADWSALESVQGEFDQTYLTEIKTRVLEAQRRGQTAILLFAQSPQWASGLDDPAAPPTPEHYRDYADALLYLYESMIDPNDNFDIRSSTIEALEVWNEPNAQEFWPTASVRPPFYVLVDLNAAREYAGLLGTTYDTLKNAHPGITILGGSLASGDKDYLEAMYQVWGGISKFDGLSLHPYARVDEHDGSHYGLAQYPDQCNSDDPLSPPWCFKRGIEEIRTVMNRHGDRDKSIWITEFGVGSSNTWGDAGSESEQAEHYRRALDIIEQWQREGNPMGIKTMIFYRLMDEGDDTFGIYQSDETPKPVYNLLQNRVDGRGNLIEH